MELPPDIERQVLAYLHLEYGESPRQPGALKAADLHYEGEFLVDGTPTHFWSYPSSTHAMWATVAPMLGTYAIGMTGTSPRDLRRA